LKTTIREIETELAALPDMIAEAKGNFDVDRAAALAARQAVIPEVLQRMKAQAGGIIARIKQQEDNLPGATQENQAALRAFQAAEEREKEAHKQTEDARAKWQFVCGNVSTLKNEIRKLQRDLDLLQGKPPALKVNQVEESDEIKSRLLIIAGRLAELRRSVIGAHSEELEELLFEERELLRRQELASQVNNAETLRRDLRLAKAGLNMTRINTPRDTKKIRRLEEDIARISARLAEIGERPAATPAAARVRPGPPAMPGMA